MSAVEVVDSYLGALPGGCRRVAHGEWGITVVVETLDEPLDVGISIADELVRVKAPALLHADAIDPWMLLWWNRQTRLVRFGCTRSREIWVHGDLPVRALDERMLDRLLGLVVEGAAALRSYAARSRAAEA
jgi:Putative bacterial sensory transduction regulator